MGSLLNVVERSAALSPSTETESDLSSDYSSLEFTSETSDGAAFYMSLSFEFLNHRLEGSTRDLWYEGLVRDHLAAHPLGSENHFGLIDVEGTLKYALWESFDLGVFEGLTRDGNPLKKSFNAEFERMFNTVKLPKLKK